MTTRPGNAALGLWQNHRTKRAANLIKIVRKDGEIVRYSDHDRALTFEGETYTPAVFSGTTAERREVAVTTPQQQLYGVVDGSRMLLPDLSGQRYRGAEVYHVVTDWQWPWLVIARHYKTVRTVQWDGLRFIAQLDGVTQALERPVGGRFGGVMTSECPYVLGDADTCKANIGPDSQFSIKVETLTDDRIDFTAYAASYTSGYDDDFYRYGEVQWKFAPPSYAGNANAGATSLTQTPDPGWTPSEHVGRYLLILDATNGQQDDTAVLITANTSDTLTYDTLALGAPGVTDYEVCALSDKWNLASPIIKHTDATRRFELFAPTPFAIQVGERGVLRPGCDGLFTTCKTKFSNQANFGGNHLQPNAADVFEAKL